VLGRKSKLQRTDAEVLRARLKEWVLDNLLLLAGAPRRGRGLPTGSLLRRLVMETKVSGWSEAKSRPDASRGALGALPPARFQRKTDRPSKCFIARRLSNAQTTNQGRLACLQSVKRITLRGQVERHRVKIAPSIVTEMLWTDNCCQRASRLSRESPRRRKETISPLLVS
jgi:hypothetical protein